MQTKKVKQRGKRKQTKMPNTIVGPVMRSIAEFVVPVAKSDDPILLLGETGTGKELLADFIYSQSDRADKPFHAVNCAAIPESLAESELFGYKRGAFTGAVTDKPGHFQAADQGTLFLDEIGDLPGYLQAKILRVVQEGKCMPVGGTKEEPTGVRLIAATNRPGRMRNDLLYRFSRHVHIPAVVQRPEDMHELVTYAVRLAFKSAALTKDRPLMTLTDLMLCHLSHWPGNVRQILSVFEGTKYFEPTVVTLWPNGFAVDDRIRGVLQYRLERASRLGSYPEFSLARYSMGFREATHPVFSNTFRGEDECTKNTRELCEWLLCPTIEEKLRRGRIPLDVARSRFPNGCTVGSTIPLLDPDIPWFVTWGDLPDTLDKVGRWLQRVMGFPMPDYVDFVVSGAYDEMLEDEADSHKAREFERQSAEAADRLAEDVGTTASIRTENEWWNRPLADVRNEQIARMVDACGGNKTVAASRLGCNPKTVRRELDKNRQ